MYTIQPGQLRDALVKEGAPILRRMEPARAEEFLSSLGQSLSGDLTNVDLPPGSDAPPAVRPIPPAIFALIVRQVVGDRFPLPLAQATFDTCVHKVNAISPLDRTPYNKVFSVAVLDALLEVGMISEFAISIANAVAAYKTHGADPLSGQNFNLTPKGKGLAQIEISLLKARLDDEREQEAQVRESRRREFLLENEGIPNGKTRTHSWKE